MAKVLIVDIGYDELGAKVQKTLDSIKIADYRAFGKI